MNLSKGQPQVFKTPHHPTFQRDLHLKALDVALATSAAPTVFPVAQIGDELFADGGLFANSPDELALHEAEHFLGIQRTRFRVLSIGTTTAQFSLSHRSGLPLGIFGWGQEQRLLQALIASQQLIVDNMLRHKLGDSYVRVDALQSRDQQRDLGLDVATPEAQKTIRALALASFQACVNNPKLDEMLRHDAEKPTWYSRLKKL